MIWLQFAATALVIVLAGVRLARYGDVLGEKTGLGRSWIGVVLLATTTSLPELFTGFGATALAALPDIALGDVLGSCMFNLLILSLMDAVHPEPISARLFLIGLTYKVMTKRFVVAWDTGAIAAVYAGAVVLSYLMVS